MSRSNNSRKGSSRGRNATKEFWSKRAESKVSGSRGVFAKKRTHKIERQLNKPILEDAE